MALKLAIVGRPNVGKSTLFNRLAGKKLAIVDDQPGVTRDRRFATGRLGDLDLELIDTAGFEDVTDESLEARMRAQTELAVDEADVALFVIDAREGVTPGDQIFAEVLRRKNKPVVLAAGILWLLVSLSWQSAGLEGVDESLRHNLLEYGGLLLFLLAAMTFVNTLEERQVFAALRDALVERQFSFRALFWLTGAIAFVLSPVLDNLTTSLVMGAVVLSTARGSAWFCRLPMPNWPEVLSPQQ